MEMTMAMAMAMNVQLLHTDSNPSMKQAEDPVSAPPVAALRTVNYDNQYVAAVVSVKRRPALYSWCCYEGSRMQAGW